MLHVDYNKVFACFAVKIFKNTPLKNFKRGRMPDAPALDPPLTHALKTKI